MRLCQGMYVSFLPSTVALPPRRAPIACCTAPAVKGELSSLPSAEGGAAPLPEVPAMLAETVGTSSSLRNESSITSSAIGQLRFLAGLNFCQNFLKLGEHASSVTAMAWLRVQLRCVRRSRC